MEAEARRAFILANTTLRPVPHVPEISLHLAQEAMELWQKTEDELAEIGLPPPFWAFAWAGGQALVRYVLDRPEVVKGKAVLDFASGSGLAGIAAMKAGASSATGVDIDPFAGDSTALNAQVNGITMAATDADLIGKSGDWEVILAGDICYEKTLAARVMQWLKAEQKRGVAVLIGDPGRAYLPKDWLECLAEYRVPVVGALEDREIKETGVWRLAQ